MNQTTDRLIKTNAAVFLGLYLFLLQGTQLVVTVVLWPHDRSAADFVSLDMETRLLILAALSGSIGAVAALLVNYVDLTTRGALISRQGWWFGVPPMIGATAGFLIYIAVRGGLIKLDQSADVLNPYTICAVSAFAGLCWRQLYDQVARFAERQASLSRGEGVRNDKSGGGTSD